MGNPEVRHGISKSGLHTSSFFATYPRLVGSLGKVVTGWEGVIFICDDPIFLKKVKRIEEICFF